MFFDSWYSIYRILIVGVLSYISLTLMLRATSNRTLSQMNAFDFTVSVAIGSIFSTIIMNKDVSLVEGLTAFILLIGLQFIVSWLSMRYPSVENIVKSDPHLLYYQGIYLKKAMKRTRLHKDDIYQAARSQGIHSMDSIAAVVLEANGKLSIIEASDQEAIKTLQNLDKF